MPTPVPLPLLVEQPSCHTAIGARQMLFFIFVESHREWMTKEHSSTLCSVCTVRDIGSVAVINRSQNGFFFSLFSLFQFLSARYLCLVDGDVCGIWIVDSLTYGSHPNRFGHGITFQREKARGKKDREANKKRNEKEEVRG